MKSENKIVTYRSGMRKRPTDFIVNRKSLLCIHTIYVYIKLAYGFST